MYCEMRADGNHRAREQVGRRYFFKNPKPAMSSRYTTLSMIFVSLKIYATEDDRDQVNFK